MAVEDAVRSYLFNSQLLSRDDGSMLLVVPEDAATMNASGRTLGSVDSARAAR